MEQIENNLVTLKEYADSRGISYEAIRRQIPIYENAPELEGHIHLQGRTKYLDEDAVRFFDSKRGGPHVSVGLPSDKKRISELELEIEEIKEERDKLRLVNEKYVEKYEELQNKYIEHMEHPENLLDSTKYMLIEDHQKLEQELKEKETRISELENTSKEKSEENKKLKEDLDALKDVTIKNVELSRNIEKKREEIAEIEKKNNEIEKELSKSEIEKEKVISEKTVLEAEIKKIITEKEIAEIKAKQEIEEALKLGFFARRKKLKELKNNKN